VLSALLFVFLAPFLVLYATGYRFSLSDALTITRTGGIYVSVGESGVDIYVDGKIVKRTNIFQKGAFVQNLSPDLYEVSVVKSGFQEWKKSLKVLPETVTEAYSFQLPVTPLINEIGKYLPRATSTATSTPSVPPKINPEYVLVSELFDNKNDSLPRLSQNATSSDKLKILRKLSVANEDGQLIARWTGDIESAPSYFCDGAICEEQIAIVTPSRVKTFDFFPGRGDLLIVAIAEGVFVVEIDNRSVQNIQSILEGEGLDFRIRDGNTIYIQSGGKFLLVSL